MPSRRVASRTWLAACRKSSTRLPVPRCRAWFGSFVMDATRFHSEGFLLVTEFVDDQWLARLESSLGPTRFAERNILTNSAIREFATSLPVRELMIAVLDPCCFAVRAILFDKTPTANWNLGWH